jgi:arylsulfatase A-like enzyme
MSRTRLLFAAVFAFGLGVSSLFGATPKMNFISIVTDDQASWSLGCYGNKESITPHMDRLAKEGARFANAFTVTPVCSPSRVTFMTGLYGTQMGITDYLAPNEETAGLGLTAKAVTWPKVLHDAGYTTAHIGKWHLGRKDAAHPTKQGYDHFYGMLGGGASPMNPTYDFPDGPKVMEGYGANLLTDEAIRWIGSVKGKDKPFAISLHFREPHTAYTPVPEEDSKLFANLDPTVPEQKGLDNSQIKQWTREYYAAIHSVDRNLGRLFAMLEREGLWDNTIIQFTSDHGYNIGHHGIHTKGNGFWVAGGIGGPKRPNMWDTSLRIPLLVRWPGVVKGGTVLEQQVLNLDTFPSVLAMLNVTAPADWKVEGDNYATLLRGDQGSWRTDWFGQYDLHNAGLAYMRMIRTADWKYVRHFHENLMDELYDLKNDPDETRNLLQGAGRGKGASANPKAGKQGKGAKNAKDADAPKVTEIVAELEGKMDQWMKRVNDPILKETRLRGWMEPGEIHD